MARKGEAEEKRLVVGTGAQRSGRFFASGFSFSYQEVLPTSKAPPPSAFEGYSFRFACRLRC